MAFCTACGATIGEGAGYCTTCGTRVEAPEAAAPAAPPAGWHPDPTGRHQQRYWDGSNWTEHVADGTIPSIDPLQSGGPNQAAASTSLGATKIEDIKVNPSIASAIGATLAVVGLVSPFSGNGFTGGIGLTSIGSYLPDIGYWANLLALMVAGSAALAVARLVSKVPSTRKSLALGNGALGLAGALGALILASQLSLGHWGVGFGAWALIGGMGFAAIGGLSGMSSGD